MTRQRSDQEYASPAAILDPLTRRYPRNIGEALSVSHSRQLEGLVQANALYLATPLGPAVKRAPVMEEVYVTAKRALQVVAVALRLGRDD